MGDKLNMLVIQNHIKSQNTSLFHPSDILLVSEPQEETQLKRNQEPSKLKRLSDLMWFDVVKRRMANTRATGR